MQVRLKALTGAMTGKEILIPKPQCLVGRGKECHLRSRMDSISQRHCMITTTDNDVIVCDLNSLNGTYVNGKKVTGETVLGSGDQLRIGPLLFEVVFESVRIRKQYVGFKEVASGTAGGNANLSTLVVESAKRLEAEETEPDLDSNQVTDDTPYAEYERQPVLEPGQSVMISGGILLGTKCTIIKKVAGGCYLVSLKQLDGEVWARIPEHLLQVI
jgi:predicted component of type VI protein secretion system